MLLASCALATAATAVLDGDTVTIGADRIRIANIDAPEIHHYACDADMRRAWLGVVRL